jgi:hypothetical protein
MSYVSPMRHRYLPNALSAFTHCSLYGGLSMLPPPTPVLSARSKPQVDALTVTIAFSLPNVVDLDALYLLYL